MFYFDSELNCQKYTATESVYIAMTINTIKKQHEYTFRITKVQKHTALAAIMKEENVLLY